MNKKGANSIKVEISPKNSAKLLPKSPGVYIFLDDKKSVIYVGKAKDLRSRVSSYFNSKEIRAIRIKKEVANIDFIVTKNEEDALILENDLIKKNKPKLNVRLKDDKSFPYIKINIKENFPQFFMTRNLIKDGSIYFGPYSSATNIRKTLRLINKIFPYTSCEEKLPIKLCLEFHINRNISPCSGELNKKQYAKIIDQSISFLEGNTKNALNELKKSMWDAAKLKKYEKAASIRDSISAAESLFEKQSIITSDNANINLDAFEVASNSIETWVDVMQVREGKLKARDHFQMEVQDFHDKKQILSSFMQSYYLRNDHPPKEIIVSESPDDIDMIIKILQLKYNRRIPIIKPKRGSKKEIIKFLTNNLIKWVEYRESRINSNDEANELSLINIQEQLNLESKPFIIECYDISHVQGTNVVGSMVVFKNGKPDKSKYRKFELKTSQKNDDYSALKEVISRRLNRINDSELPNLMLIDGGKGQLSACHEVLLANGYDAIEIASIAKQKEEIFMPNNFESVILENGSYGKHLIQRIRDEAHRFAITYHRSKRSKQMISSELDTIAGIGPKKKKALINSFGSIKNIRNASYEELIQLKAITKKDAEKIKDSIN
ncbi:MAG: excinuclease ABC subunit UvrC [Chloroflexota bacterium]|nr:excinuclease ABC subunit UvrC [Chloroflexota bacterium]